MKIRILAALAVLSVSACTSGNSFQAIDIESPLQCGELDFNGNAYAERFLLQQKQLIASELKDERPVHFYFKNALVPGEAASGGEMGAHRSKLYEVCSKYPSKGINDAIIEAAEETFKLRGDSLIVQRCSKFPSRSSSSEAKNLATSIHRRVTESDRAGDLITPEEVLEILGEQCRSNPDAMVQLAANAAVRDSHGLMRERRESAQHEAEAAFLENYNKKYNRSLVQNGDLSCDLHLERQEMFSQGRQSLGEEAGRFIYQDVKDVAQVNFPNINVSILERVIHQIDRQCDPYGGDPKADTIKGAIQQYIDWLERMERHPELEALYWVDPASNPAPMADVAPESEPTLSDEEAIQAQCARIYRWGDPAVGTEDYEWFQENCSET